VFDRDEYIKQPSAIEKELKTLFEDNRPLIFFEIGACEGEDSVKYARLFPDAMIYSFEPLPGNFKLIKNNLVKYNITNVFPVNIALSDAAGEAEFYVSSANNADNPGNWDYGNKSSSLLAPEKHIEIIDFIEFNEKIKIKTTTIDAFCRDNEIKAIDFVHLDVQGAELMVLKGARAHLNSIKAIWLEVSKVSLYKDQPLEREVFNFMGDNGFVLAKNKVDGITGDQLYVNKRHIPQDIMDKLSYRDGNFFRSLSKSLRRLFGLK